MNPSVATRHISINAEALTWMAVHGNLCLALRHPDNKSPAVRARMVALIQHLALVLVQSGLLTQDEIDEAMRYEREDMGNAI